MAELGEPLSEREVDVVRCLASGATNKEIATELSISRNTVKVHLRNIYAKLGVSSRTEATTAAIQHGYVAIPGTEAVETPALVTTDEGVMLAGTASASTMVPSATNGHAAATAERRSWRTPALALLLTISLLALGILGLQVLSQSNALSTPEPFVETPLGDTRWLTSRPLPDARAGMAVAAVGLELYQIAGETDAGVDGVVRVFDSRTKEWRDAAAKPTPVADAGAAELYGEIYLVGGRTATGEATSIVEAYLPSQDAWRAVAALPEALYGGLTLTDGSFLYVFGGRNADGVLDGAYVYDPAADSWRPLPALPEATAFAAGGALAGQMLVVGGTDGDAAMALCQRFDPLEEAWSSCPDMLLPRAGAGSTVLLNKLYVIGGGLESDEAVAFSEVFDPNTETWQVVNTPEIEEANGWPLSGVTHIESRIYSLGGRQGDVYLDSNLVYAPLVYQTFIPAASSGGEQEQQ